jgi:putative spermidine/putrescine transport system ATP-binding protein
LSTIVSFRDISKTYDGRTLVIRNLDLDVVRGEFLTLLGPSGSGKTTLLMMLAGFEAPTGGEIFVDGRPVSSLPPHKRDIGMVFQNYALFPHMTVGDNIRFPLEVRKFDEAEINRRTARALEMVRLPGVAQRRPTELSGGQQQRIALARALIFEPKIVLMDEPLGALDRQLRESMQLEIKRIHEQIGVTIVYVTHDQSEALTMSDRIAVFNRGRIEQLANPKVLYDRPQNAFVATFVGDNNILRGTLLRRQGDEVEVALLDTEVVVARAADVAAAGEALICVRPENVRIATLKQGCSSKNSFPATVIQAIYFGDHVKLIMRVNAVQSLAVKSSTEMAFQVGDKVCVGWDPGDCVAFRPLDRDDEPEALA